MNKYFKWLKYGMNMIMDGWMMDGFVDFLSGLRYFTSKIRKMAITWKEYLASFDDS